MEKSQDEIYKEGYEEGYKDGYAVGYRVIAKIAIIKILTQKFTNVPKNILQKIDDENDEKKLDTIEDAALDAESLEEFSAKL